MREIKFRAWDKQKQKMLDFEKIQLFITEGKITIVDILEFCRAVEDFELIQYTGLKDKNGKEIYEGDVVQELYNRHIFLWVVKWSDDYASFYIQNKGVREAFSSDDMLEVIENGVVISNIYENPELIL